MADLVSRLQISGNIGARTLSFSHTFTIEDVYDVGTRMGDGPSDGVVLDSNGGSQSNGTPTFVQAGPSYLLLKNDARSVPAMFRLNNAGGTVVPEIHLMPGALAILPQITPGGIMNVSATANTSTLVDVEQVDGDTISAIGLAGIPSILVAYTATS